MAQRGPQLAVTVVTAPRAGAAVTAKRLLSDGKTRELLLSGFTAVMHFRLELWRVGGLFDNLDTAAAWDVLVRYDAYSKTYQIARRSPRATEVSANIATADSAESALELPVPVPLAPLKSGAAYYYFVTVDVETLSVSDLDELQRWLRGDLQPAVRGKTDPVSALRRGIGTLLSRMLGGERRHYEARSVTFRG
ncbi:MAG TPA: hypothetical protein VF483_11735 [Gemmatimonadaceae bacterium]